MIRDLTPRELAERLADNPPPLVLDVREDWERRVALIEGSVHVALGELPGRVEELPDDRDIVVYCHHGNRSRAAASWLQASGRPHVYNLAGGIDSWSQQIDPNVPRYH